MKKKLKDVTVGEFFEHFENHQYINCYKCPLNSFKYYGKTNGCYCDIKACDIVPELLDKEINLVLDSESIKKKFRDITVKEFFEHFENWECINKQCVGCPASGEVCYMIEILKTLERRRIKEEENEDSEI